MNWDKYRKTAAGFVLLFGVAVVGALLTFLLTAPAKAADKGGQSFLPIGEVASSQGWTGLGVGLYGAYINADTDTSPISIGSSGLAAGGVLSYSVQMSSLVLEVFGEYGGVFGDLNDIGVETEMAVGGKAGILFNPQTLVYGLGAKSWLDTNAVGSIEGWQYGGGVQIRLSSAPLFLNLEYRHGMYETANVLGVDATTDTIRGGLTYKFNFSK